MRLELEFECDEAWDLMIGNNDRQRLCLSCDKQVYNLVGLSQREAEAVIAEHWGDMCARFRRIDGIVAFADDPRAQLVDQRTGLKKLVVAAVIPLVTVAAQFHTAVSNTAIPPSYGCVPDSDEYRVKRDVFVERFFSAGERDETGQEVLAFLSFGLTKTVEEKYENANSSVVSGGVMF